MNIKAYSICLAMIMLGSIIGSSIATFPVEMEKTRKESAVFGSGKILPPFVDKGVDLDGNGKYDLLSISVNVSISVRGNFLLRAGFDIGGGGIGVENYTVRFLETGNHTMVVNLEGRFFGTSELNGPYDVTCVLTAETLMESKFLDNYSGKTKGYASSQFDSYPKDVKISGRLEDAITHSGVPGFLAVLMPNKFIGITTTNLSGDFTTNVPSGLGVLYAAAGRDYINFVRLRRITTDISLTIPLYPRGNISANISGIVRNVSGTPLFGVKMMFVNYSTGYTTEASTHMDGSFTVSLPAGKYHIFSFIEKYYPDATTLDVNPGENGLNITLKEAPEISQGKIRFLTWETISQSSNITFYSHSIEIRVQADLLGDLDMNANRSEVADCIELMLSGNPLLPEVNSYETFDVDGIFFDPVPGTSELSILTEGNVMDTRIPLYLNFSRAYHSNSSIPVTKDHEINLNISYDSTLVLYLSYGFEMSSSNHSANATVTGKDIVTITMRSDPEPQDNNDSEWVSVTASAVIPGYIEGTIKDKKGNLISGAYINTTGANTTSDAQGRYNLTLETGIYSIEVSKPGFSTEVASDLVVYPGKTTIQDFILKTVPDSPQGLQASAGDGVVNLSWNPPSYDGGSPVTKYNIYRGDSSANLTLLTSVSVTAYSDTDVINGNTYYYAVSAMNSVGEGKRTDAVSARPFRTEVKPQPPTNLTASGGNGYVDLTWTPSPTPNVTYKIYRSTTPGNWNTVIAENLTGRSYRDTGVINGITYYYVVRAVTSSGVESDPSNEASATPAGEKTVQPEIDYGLIAIVVLIVIIILVILLLLIKGKKATPEKEEATGEEEPSESRSEGSEETRKEKSSQTKDEK